MDLLSIFKALMLFIGIGSKPETPLTNGTSLVNVTNNTEPIATTFATSSPTTTIETKQIEPQSFETSSINANDQNDHDVDAATEAALMAYDFDCGMPYPPPTVISDWNEKTWEEGAKAEAEEAQRKDEALKKEYRNQETQTESLKEEVEISKQEPQSESLKEKDAPKTEMEVWKPKTEISKSDAEAPKQEVERPHAKATFTIPIHIVHKLPDSAVEELRRFEDYCEEKILDCYHAIREFNNYNYEKNQEIQYLSYTVKRKQEIIEESQKKKAQIQTTYNKMHQVCVRTERKREKITTVLNPYLKTYSPYFTQPKRVPKEWYDIQNLETIVQQLFTPKLRCRMHYDEKIQALRMSRMPIEDLDRKEFMPLPDVYLSAQVNDETIDGASVIMEENHPDTPIAIGAQIKHADQFNRNVLEQYTYSTNEDIQQMIIYYVFKFYELKVQDGTRKVFHYTRLLKEKKGSDGCTKDEISNLEDRVSTAIKELQANTIEMERNRVVPELIGLYNAENEAKRLLPDTKLITKLIGPNNRRVITAFNPSDTILFNALDGKQVDLIVGENGKELTNADGRSLEKPQHWDKDLKEPLQWDKNWTWDY